jgi:hypothetical protein
LAVESIGDRVERERRELRSSGIRNTGCIGREPAVLARLGHAAEDRRWWQ